MPDFILDDAAWPAMPDGHRAFLRAAVAMMRTVPAVCGLAAGGSFLSRLDAYSDLDLIVVVAPDATPLGRLDREHIAAGLGPVLAAFSGEHVNEPRLLICLYGPPLLHVDLKFLPATQLNPRVEDPVVLWDRNGDVRSALAAGSAAYPSPDRQWIEDRFWVWVHYVATKIGRGELLEAVDSLGALRRLALGPLALERGGVRPDGVRRAETLSSGTMSMLAATVAPYDRAACYRALLAAIALYREQRAASRSPALVQRSQAEAESVSYLETIGRALGLDP
jgi:hypothetical protein